MLKPVLFCVVFSATFSCLAQASPTQPSAASANATTDYAGEPTVIERNDREITYATDGTGSEHQTVVTRVQTDAAAKNLSVVSFPYASASQRIDIEYLRVRHPDGSTVTTPITDALDMPTEVMRQAPFYSDLKQKQIPIRGLRSGDRLEWSVRLIYISAEAPGHFWGSSAFTGKEAVALSESFTLRFPKSVTVIVQTPKLNPTITEEGEDRIYRWTSSQLDLTQGPIAQARKDAEKKRLLAPEEMKNRTDGELPQIAWTNFPNWASVGAWYRTLEGDRVAPDESIKAKVRELVQGKSTDEAKMRALYDYAATQIRYIGVALGQGRYQPHLASEVMINQYGDCKDKATLLASLLAAAGYQADTALIGAGIRFNDSLPSPGSFNHAITAVSLGSGSSFRTIWLDSTQEVAPYRALLFGLRDKQALRVPLEGTAHLDRTPADLPFESFQKFQASGTLDSTGLAKGKLSFTYRGDDEIALRLAVRQVSPSQYDQLAQYLLGAMGFGGKVSHAMFTPPDHTTEPMVMSFDYEREKPGGDWSNYRIVILDGPDQLPVLDEKEPPQVPLELGVPRTLTSHSELVLPVDWGVTLPGDIHQINPWIRFDRVYQLEHGTLIEDKTVVILQRKVPLSALPDYKKFADVVLPGTYPYVRLIPTISVEDLQLEVVHCPSTQDGKKLTDAAFFEWTSANKNRSSSMDRRTLMPDDSRVEGADWFQSWNVTHAVEGNGLQVVCKYQGVAAGLAIEVSDKVSFCKLTKKSGLVGVGCN
jgi:hypothetical protein